MVLTQVPSPRRGYFHACSGNVFSGDGFYRVFAAVDYGALYALADLAQSGTLARWGFVSLIECLLRAQKNIL